jgi:peptidoglycan/LPS O-acetylase OafA/YrhL
MTRLPAGLADPIPSLNGIRAIAVMMVLAAHAGLENLVPGGLGVTIFFVLSGFLITTLMRIEQARSGAIDFRAFYLRRVLRLLPPLLVVVAAAAAMSALSISEGGFSRKGLLSVLFYFGNYHVIAEDFHGIPAGIGVVWSLAVEEHYYLLYPPIAALLMRRLPPRRAAAILGAACVAILAWRMQLASLGESEAYIGMATDTRIDAILAGCILAFAANPWLSPPAASPRRDRLIAAACFAILLASVLWRDPLFRLTLRYSLQSLAIAGLLWLAVARSTHPALRWLNSPAAVYLGTVSYTVYLCHQLIGLALTRHWPGLPWYAVLPSTLLLSLAVAEPMRLWVEAPFARWRRRLHREPRPSATRAATLAGAAE